MQLEFSYLRKGEQCFPIIDVKAQYKKKALTIKALVDSGASYSVFRLEIADYLGIKLEKGKAFYLEGIAGRILGYLHIISLIIGNKTYKCKVVFSREFTVSFNILGRDTFFTPFLITFYEKKKKVLIKTI
ncbi:MAG: hypothetical protein A3J51_00865 [Omnitrophica WOR_2 bacterium RIFCSPHIGHO2_02_FULL_45_21]|nr:MAG: hypothetical protein A3J51_00865 [Omnitrophica WOR_2 bacterium RIFCSPHIGHO2_02_FULL_45_21]